MDTGVLTLALTLLDMNTNKLALKLYFIDFMVLHRIVKSWYPITSTSNIHNFNMGINFKMWIDFMTRQKQNINALPFVQQTMACPQGSHHTVSESAVAFQHHRWPYPYPTA